MSADEKRFGIWHSGLTDHYYAGFAKRRKGTTPDQDLWEASGVKHDVTVEDVRAQRLAASPSIPPEGK